MASNSDIKKTLGLIKNIKQTTNPELKLQSLEQIKANLTNNESNLKVFKQLCGFKTLCGLLKNNINTRIINLVLSILANCAMKHEVCKEIVTEHHVLADVSLILHDVEYPSIHCRAIRLIANVAKTNLYSKYVLRFPLLQEIVCVLSNSTSSDSIITCVRAIKHLWLWDQYRVHSDLIKLKAIKVCMDKLTLLNDKPSMILNCLTMVQAMLNVNSKTFMSQLSYLHCEWMVNLLTTEAGRYDTVLIQILLKLCTDENTHFNFAKTCLLDLLITLMWPLNSASPVRIQQLTKILSALCKENLFRQKIIQSQNAIVALLTYLDADVIEPIGEERNETQPVRDESEETQNLPLNEDAVIEIDDVRNAGASTSSSKPGDATPTKLLTNAIHYNILLCINHYQYDEVGLCRFVRLNLIPILMKRLAVQIDKHEYKHSAPVCDQSNYLSTRQALSKSGNMSPLSPGNTSPQSASLSPARSPVWLPGAAILFEATIEMGDMDDDDRSVYSPQIEFSDDEALSNTEDNDSNDVRQLNTSSLASEDKEERLDVQIIRIMLHISYIQYPFEQLSHKSTWNTLVDYLVKVQQDDCCRNVYKILLVISKKRHFLRPLLLDNFILVVHKKLCRVKHGPHCMICSNVMIYGQGILNEIANETNSHFGFSEIMYHYNRLLEVYNRLHEVDNRSQGDVTDHNGGQTDGAADENSSEAAGTNASRSNESKTGICPSHESNTSQRNLYESNTSQRNLYESDTSQRNLYESSTSQRNLNESNTSQRNMYESDTSQTNENLAERLQGGCAPGEPGSEETPSVEQEVTSSLNNDPPLIHFMIPYLLKDHPSFPRILFGSDAILSRILSGLDGRYQEEAVSCVEELLSLDSNEEATKYPTLCREKCPPPPSFEGDITFLLDDGTCQKANRDLLTTRSLYFETMLCGNFKECDQKSNIKLGNISSSCFSHLLKLIAHYDTCALPRNDIDVYLELIVKSDEYLLHELNYKLIQLLYAPDVIVNPASMHRVYAWSLRFSDFVQGCLSNYENIFSKADFSPLPLGSVKRMRRSETDRDDRETCAASGVVQVGERGAKKDFQKEGKPKCVGNTSEDMVVQEIESFGKEVVEDTAMEVESVECKEDSNSDAKKSNERIDDNRSSESRRAMMKTTENNDRAMGELTLTSLSTCDTNDVADSVCKPGDSDTNKDVNSLSEKRTRKVSARLTDQPGCSYDYDEKIQNNRGEISESLCDNSEISVEKKTETHSVETASEEKARPCLISDIINQIDQKNKALHRKGPSASSLPPLNKQTTGIDPDSDKIQAILLLKNEPSFSKRKLQTPVFGKRKSRDLGGHSLGTADSKARESLNIHLIKQMFGRNRNYRKSVEIVRNLIAMSDEGDVFELFKQDLYDIINDRVKM